MFSMTNKNINNNTETLFTMKQLANLAKVAKPTIFRYLERENIKETTIKGNTKYYNETVHNVVLEHFKQRSSSNMENENNNDTRNDDTTLLLKELKEQYKNTVEEKNKEIEYLRKALDQQQQLQAQANANYKELKEENAKLLEHSEEEKP
ncbi:DUF536 domain-containing protein, partial [Listeria monocytogenes]|nr:DUF536 domain-containing protein [Listeria monocytogenes]EAF5240853.1 DUF536 domain-containing protein [Listeria monocytogenes]